ncbi:MAG: type II toxin-antitoxin system MqsA family antitoxin [Dehalococcoidia bacterium]
MHCRSCKGALESKLITYVSQHDGRVTIIENVPALVCSQCSEQSLRPDVADKIQQLVWNQPAPKRQDSVPVYDLSEVA